MLFNRGLIDYRWPDGHIESLDVHVEPRSLYRAQLEERTGHGPGLDLVPARL
eukprot:SAG22_NODE_870_length_6749_cov_2.083308_4_plen_52_part_00